MLCSIAPSGISGAALLVLQEALDLILAINRQRRERDPAEDSNLDHVGLLSAAVKLVSQDPEVLEDAFEREGLLKLLTLAEDVARHDARNQPPSLADPDRPDIELGDLRRRARNAVLVDPEAGLLVNTSDRSMPWKETLRSAKSRSPSAPMNCA
jgi:hypothetical protein